MIKIPELHPVLRAWLLEGPLAAQVPAYVARLRRGRYATHTCGRCLNGVAHFAHWMSTCFLRAHMLDEGCIDQFLRFHLPRCDCLGGALRTPRELHAALVPMLEILRAEHVIARPPEPVGPIADELRNYDAHMRDARGEGRNTAFISRAGEDCSSLSRHASEMAEMPVHVIVTAGAPGVRAAMNATMSVPIVMGSVGDTVAQGFVSSLSRPGENATGMTSFNTELSSKRLDLLAQALPTLRQVVALREAVGDSEPVHATETAARTLRATLI